MADVIKLESNNPLVGTWQASEEDSSAVFVISMQGRDLCVTGYDKSDGEAFVISNVNWDGKTLRFESVMPSTGYYAKHSLRMLPGSGQMEHELTVVETWKKIAVKESK